MRWPADNKIYHEWLGRQAWLYTLKTYDEFDFHIEYWLPIGGNSGVSIRDPSRAHHAIREPDSANPELAKFPKTSPAHIGYEIQILDDDHEKYPSGSIYDFVPGKTGLHQSGKWNSMDIESRHGRIRSSRSTGSYRRKAPAIQLSKDRPHRPAVARSTTFILFRNIRLREH